MWQMLLISSSLSSSPLPSNDETAGLLKQFDHQLRLLPDERWRSLAEEEEAHQPPLLLRVALRESVKDDTAPYRRHMIVLSTHPAVAQAAKELRLQIKVCKDHDDLAKYLLWLHRDPAAAALVASRAPWRARE